MKFEDVMQAITDTLAECDGEYIAEVHNKVCSKPIEYKGDSVWAEIPPGCSYVAPPREVSNE